ncbi:MAG: hypothetical protein IJL71_01035, partial [Oscillospiraceae bacterium]|nr:hypothetical protein [Oscillospiraceae bacterium]
VLMASYDITQLDPNTQYKFSSLFQKSWNPKNTENINDPLEIFQRSFWENTEKVKKGDKILESKRKIKCVSNFNYDFSMSFSLFMRSCYNKETNDNYGCGGIMFSGGITAGITEYFLIPAGPVVVPVYIGFEGHLKINTAVNVNFGMDQPPTGHDQDKEWRYSTDDGVDVNSRIEIIVGLSVFGGVGVKGVLGASATGYVDFDIATVIGKGRDEFGDPHSFIDVLYGLRIEYYLLFYSGTINLDCLNGAKRLADSRGEYDKMLAEAMEEMEFKEISFAECAENYVPQVYSGEKPRDRMFILQNTDGQLQGNPDIVSVDTSVYPDTQIQFAATRDYTALFRIASNGERTDIYYQRQNRDNGNISSGIYRVALPEGETRSVSEFVVVPNKTDWDDPKNNNKVYIGAILVDDKAKDEEARIRSTDVCAIVVDLDETYTTSSVIASDPSDRGRYLYSAPMPAGREDYCSVAYAATALKEDNGTGVSGIKQLMGVIPAYTSYYLSWGEKGNAAKRSFRNLGSNKIYSTGAIAPNEPSYWTVDTYRSSDKYLVLNGYGANGYYEETLRSNFRFDIEGIVDPASVKEGRVNYNSIVTNWQYLNGCSYFVAGGSVYWMNKKAKGSDPADYEWSVEKVKNGSGIVSVDNRYTMITNNNQSAVYLIGVVGDYDVNVEEGTSEKGSNIAKIYTVTTDKNWSTGEMTCTLHGPLDLKFAKGDHINCFTAAYNPDDCKASGLSIAYSTPASDTSRYACNIRLWKQNADKGLLVTDVKIPDYRVIQGQPYIEMNVTVRNYGYGRENPIPYTVYDENNTTLMQVINGQDVGQTFYTGDDLYTGDFRVDKICVRPNPDWSVNEEHEIVVDIGGSYKYNGSLDDVVNSVKMEADNTTLTANNSLIGGKHYISTSIINNTFVGKEMPAVKVVLDYGEKAGRELKFRLPTEDRLLRFSPDDTELTGRVYRFDIDMDSIWEDGLKDGLVGAYVSLVDRNGNQQSNETVYLLNPAEKRSGNPGGNTDPENPAEASYTAADGAGGRWTKGSGKDYTITIKRGDNDDDWSGHYKRTLIDGKVTDVTVKSGSGTVTIKADTLEKLTVGNHTITIEFDDGKAELTLTVSAKSSSDNSGSPDGSGKSNSPKTGDWRELSLWITLMTVGLLGIIAVIRYRKRSVMQ